MASEWTPWLEYKFEFGHPPEQATEFITRLSQAPARLAELVSSGGEKLTIRPAKDKWSILEHAGHLWTVEQLWEIRFKEFAEGKDTLYAAEMSGRSTFAGNFNDVEPSKILENFRVTREKMLNYLRGFDTEYFSRKALHPRLQKIISPVDLLYFIAEHDDHHLAVIEQLLR